MKVEIFEKGQVLEIKLIGEIDHHNAKFIREKMDSIIHNKTPKTVIIDFNLVTFMDSSGIGLIMGRYKLLSRYGSKLEVVNVNSNIYKVMLLSNLSTIATIKKRGEI